MKYLFLLVGIFPFIAMAQQKHDNRFTDSAKYYQTQMSNLLKQAYDSVTKSNEYSSTKKMYDDYIIRSHNYTGPTIFIDVVHSNYTKLNDSIISQGFSKLNNMSFRIGVGISSKTEKIMFDFTFFAMGFSNKSKNGDEKITTSLANVLQFDFGYDLLHSRIVSIYPFIGLSGRLSSLSYSKTAVTNTNYTSVANIVVNDPSVTTSSFRIGYDAGVALDFLIGENKKKTAGQILFIKAATNRPIWSDSYKIDNIKYNPEMKQADWLFSVGIKFIKRR